MTQTEIEEIINKAMAAWHLDLSSGESMEGMTLEAKTIEEYIAKAIHHKHQESLKELRGLWKNFKDFGDVIPRSRAMWNVINNLAKKEKW